MTTTVNPSATSRRMRRAVDTLDRLVADDQALERRALGSEPTARDPLVAQ